MQVNKLLEILQYGQIRPDGREVVIDKPFPQPLSAEVDLPDEDQGTGT